MGDIHVFAQTSQVGTRWKEMTDLALIIYMRGVSRYLGRRVQGTSWGHVPFSKVRSRVQVYVLLVRWLTTTCASFC